MSISNGVDANATNFNAAFLSKQNGGDTVGIIGLKNVDVNSGDEIDNAQRLINEIADSDGTAGEGDGTRKNYSTNNYVANGDDRKVAIGKLDAALKVDADNLANHISDTTTHGLVGNIVGDSDIQTLVNKTIDADSNTISNIDDGNIKAGAAIDAAKIGSGVVSTTEFERLNNVGSQVVGISDTNVLSNKEFSDAILFDEIATPSNPAANKLKFYAKDGKFYYLNSAGSEIEVGAGSGAGGVNYFPDYDAELNLVTVAWGTPSDATNFVMSVTETSPLEESYSFLLTKAASNETTEYVPSVTLTIDAGYKYRLFELFIDMVETSANYVDDYLKFEVRDSNDDLVSLQPDTLLAGTGKTGKMMFQTTDSLTYTVRLVCNTTTTTAWTVKFDKVYFRPYEANVGAVDIDWKPCTMTCGLTGATGLTVTAYEKIKGDTAFYKGKITWSAVFTGGSPTVDLPRSIDPLKAIGTTANYSLIDGTVYLIDAGTDVFPGSIYYSTATQVLLQAYSDDNGASTAFVDKGGINTTNPFTWANGDSIEFCFSVPITGLSSNMTLSEDSSGRDLSFSAKKSGTQTITAGAGATTITGWTEYNDETGSFDATAGTYTFKESRVVNISANALVSWTTAPSDGGANIISSVRGAIASYNIAKDAIITNGYEQWTPTLLGYKAVKGEVITFAATSVANDIVVNAGAYTTFSISTSNANPQIASSEAMSCKAYLSANQTGVNPNGSYVKLNFNAVLWDTHAAFNTTLYRYDMKASGKFNIKASILIDTVNVLASLYVVVVYKNGVRASDGQYLIPTAGNYLGLIHDNILNLNRGDYIEFYLYGLGNNSVNTLTVSSAVTATNVSITKVD